MGNVRSMDRWITPRQIGFALRLCDLVGSALLVGLSFTADRPDVLALGMINLARVAEPCRRDALFVLPAILTGLVLGAITPAVPTLIAILMMGLCTVLKKYDHLRPSLSAHVDSRTVLPTLSPVVLPADDATASMEAPSETSTPDDKAETTRFL